MAVHRFSYFLRKSDGKSFIPWPCSSFLRLDLRNIRYASNPQLETDNSEIGEDSDGDHSAESLLFESVDATDLQNPGRLWHRNAGEVPEKHNSDESIVDACDNAGNDLRSPVLQERSVKVKKNWGEHKVTSRLKELPVKEKKGPCVNESHIGLSVKTVLSQPSEAGGPKPSSQYRMSEAGNVVGHSNIDFPPYRAQPSKSNDCSAVHERVLEAGKSSIAALLEHYKRQLQVTKAHKVELVKHDSRQEALKLRSLSTSLIRSSEYAKRPDSVDASSNGTSGDNMNNFAFTRSGLKSEENARASRICHSPRPPVGEFAALDFDTEKWWIESEISEEESHTSSSDAPKYLVPKHRQFLQVTNLDGDANEVEGSVKLRPRHDSLLTRLAIAESKWQTARRSEVENAQLVAKELFKKAKNEIRFDGNSFMGGGNPEMDLPDLQESMNSKQRNGEKKKERGSYIFRYTKSWRIQRGNAIKYKQRLDLNEGGKFAVGRKVPRLSDNTHTTIKVLDVDRLDLEELHSRFMYTLVRWLPAERCVKIIGRIALFRDSQKQVSYERMMHDCAGGRSSGSWHKNDHSGLMAECGGEIIALLSRCYQTISVPFMLDYVRKFGQFSRAYLAKVVDNSTRVRLFDFVRYPERDGTRPLPGIVQHPDRLESYVKMLPRCSANTFLYEQLKIRNLLAPKQPSAYFASSDTEKHMMRAAAASESLTTKWTELDPGRLIKTDFAIPPAEAAIVPQKNTIRNSYIPPRPKIMDAIIAREHRDSLAGDNGGLLNYDELCDVDESLSSESGKANYSPVSGRTFEEFCKSGRIDDLAMRMQQTKIAPQLVPLLPKDKTNAYGDLIDPAEIHPRTYRSQAQQRYGEDGPKRVWWPRRWKGKLTFFRFKGKSYQRVNQLGDAPAWIRSDSPTSFAPLRRRQKHSIVRARRRERKRLKTI